MSHVVIWRKGDWAIESDGYVVNNKTGFSDSGIKYENGEIAFNFPERIPEVVKQAFRRVRRIGPRHYEMPGSSRPNPRTQHKRYRVKVVATVFARSVEEAELTMLRAIEQGRQHFALPTVVRDFAPAAEVWEIDGEGRRHGGTTLHE